MNVRLPLSLSFFLFLASSFSALASDKLILNTGTRDPFTTENKNGFLDLLIKESFQRIGIDAELIVYDASARALAHANTGVDDGVALRVKGINKKFTNLMRVPEKLMDNDFVAYSTRDYLDVGDWGSLATYEIAYILGWQIFQNNLSDHQSTTRTRNVTQLMNMLAHDRVDLILYERWQGLWHARKMDINVNVYEPPLAKREMFMYLHKKHADLVDKVSASLVEMKKDGTYQKIFDQTLTRYLR